MKRLSRRRLLQAGAALGVAGVVPQTSTEVAAQTSGSPALDKFVQELPIPSVKEPDGQREGADAYEFQQTEFTHSFHPDLPDTTVWGFDGSYPGPMVEAEQGEPIHVRVDNSELPSDHLLTVDERVDGTTSENYPNYDGPVPEVRTVTHFHGLELAPENDGQADMWTSPDGVTGPRFVNEWQELPMEQGRTTSTYHDHTLGITRLNAYAGLVGLYSITTDEEESLDLPEGEYDVPLVIQDKSFNSDGSLSYPEGFVPQFLGDTAVVNGAAWPSLEVEPRRYRFRIVNGANHRSFDLGLTNESGSGVPTMYQFAPDHGFLESVVSIGSGGDLDSLLLTSFERAEIVVDFSDYAGQTLTLTNSAEMGPDLTELVQFQVSDPDQAPSDPSADPTNLSLPSPTSYDEDDARTTREMTLGVTVDEDTGLITHTLNGFSYGDEGAEVYPRLGTTEVWELVNESGGRHPIHLHLVTFRVIGRGPDGTEPPDPNERGPKDTVRVDAGETVRIIAEFSGYTGRFPWHCHMLEHEDNKMMIPFVVEDGPLRSYANEDGVIGSDGLTDAIADWRTSDLETEDLLEVIDYWRSGDEVGE
jgi:spore coat protein A